MSFGVTPTGFVRPTLADLLDDLETEWKQIFGNAVDLSPDGPDAQILGILAGALDDVWQVGAAAYTSYKPRQAVGAALSEIVGFNGIQRLPGSKSTIFCAANTAPAPDVFLSADFRMASESGDLYGVATPGLFPDGVDRLFVAIENGPLLVGPSETWEIITPVTDLNSITNSAGTFILGSAAESDSELRARQIISTETGATNILEALYSSLLAVTGVTKVRVYVNDTNGTVDGRPPHSYEVVVEGGAVADVANAIWENHPAGIELFGTTTENITDSQGQSQAIKLTRPTLITIHVKITTSATSDYPPTGDDEMKQAIVDYAAGTLVAGESFGIGDDVLQSRLFVATNSVRGHNVDSAPSGLLIGFSASPTLSADLTIDDTELANFLIANVEVIS